MVKYPFIASAPDYDKGIYPVVIDKPKKFHDETEVWENPEFTVEKDFVSVTLKKRNKTKEEKDAVADEKKRQDDDAKSDVSKVTEAFLDFAKQGRIPRDKISEILTELRK